ncbi:MAG: hypothetical protein HGA44_20580, partial [Cellulomonadaceae bacterium]|nr:hypothetical protein [Cellulomonadaceae bacterium]
MGDGPALAWWALVSTPAVLPAALGEGGISAADAAVVTLQLVGAGAIALLRRAARPGTDGRARDGPAVA